MQNNAYDTGDENVLPFRRVKMAAGGQQPNLKETRSGKPVRDLMGRNRLLGSSKRKAFVLIVDDQSTSRKILEELVHTVDSNLIVESYGNPFEALERAGEKTPDLIITDYKMPEMNGIEFTRQVRTLPFCSDVPLMVVTIVQDKRIRYDALEAGATDFLTRPIDYHECLARCSNLLVMRRQQQIIRNRARWLEEQVAEATKQVHKREKETLIRLAKAGEYRDEGTGNHVIRMAKYSRLIAEALGMSELECIGIEQAAPMHDIGKIGVPDNILLKPGRHTDDERQVMRAHSNIGHGILKDSPSRFIQLGSVIALGHHEKFDGSGYPHGLSGEDIPLMARIVAVADVYDALTSKRPYKDAWSSSEAIDYITAESGKHFDPQCVQAFLSRLDAVKLIHEQLKDDDAPEEKTGDES